MLLRLRDTTHPATQRAERTVLGTLLVLGLLTTVFQAASLRLFYPISAARHSPEYDGLPQAAFASRTAVAQAKLPPDAIVQINPTSGHDIFYLTNLLYAERQMVTSAADDDCGAVYGGDPTACAPAQQAVRALYAFPAPGAAAAIQTCRALGATYLAASERDPAWAGRDGWVWQLPAVADTGGFRVVRCSAPRK